MSRKQDLTGMTFGRLTVLGDSGERKWGQVLWRCKCSCKEQKEILVCGGNLKSGHTKSCGCLLAESLEESRKSKRKFNTYVDKGNYLEGYDCKGRMFLIDKDDYNKVKDYYWCFNSHTNYWSTIYTINKVKNILKLHQLICPNTSNDLVVDHYNRNTSDNRKSNLFLKTHRDNCINSGLQSNNISGFIGVNYSKTEKKWRAFINFESKRTRIVGRFNTKEEAIICRLCYEFIYYGINSPQRDLFEQYSITEDFAKKYCEPKLLRSDNKTGVTGVNLSKNNKFYVYVSLKGKLKHLGSFDKFEEAVRCRLLAEKEYYPKEKWQKHLWKEYGIE